MSSKNEPGDFEYQAIYDFWTIGSEPFTEEEIERVAAWLPSWAMEDYRHAQLRRRPNNFSIAIYSRFSHVNALGSMLFSALADEVFTQIGKSVGYGRADGSKMGQGNGAFDENAPADSTLDGESSVNVDDAISLMKSGQFADALPIFLSAIRLNPKYYGNWYMAGQCFRFTNDLPNAVKHLQAAARLNPSEREVFLALGIACQLSDNFENAVPAFVKALEIDPNYDLAYNSLALTQMKMGDFEFALHNYDEALKAMTRRLVKSLRNTSTRGITKHHDSSFTLWAEYAVFGAMFIASSDNTVTDMAWPTGEFAEKEERDENYERLLWHDQPSGDGKKTRLFLPNYFNTFESRLRDTIDYSFFLRAKGTALEALGRESEAIQHYDEAEDFKPIERYS